MSSPRSTQTQLIRCRACGASNRVQFVAGQTRLPVCGRCREPLKNNSPIEVTDATFTELVERSPLPVLVDMWAVWCGPCRLLAPTIDQLSDELIGRVRVVKLNIDENRITATRFQIRSIPTLIIFVGGREVDRIIGAMPKADLLRRLQRYF